MERLKKSRPAQVLAAYGASQAGNYAPGMAFNGFMAMFPLILGMVSIVGLVISSPSVQQTLYAGIVSVFPREAHDAITGALTDVQRHAGLLGVISIVGLLWSGTSLFAAMEFALTKIFGTTQRDMLRQRLMGLVMVVVFLLAVVLAIGANSAAAASPGGGIIGVILGAVALVGLMIAIYRFVPNRTFALKEIWPGALLAGVLVEVFSLLFPLYAKISHGFGTYGQQFGLFFLLASWLIFLSQFILLGAVYNKVRLGTPQDEGIVAAPAGESRPQKDPAEVIEEHGHEAGGDSSPSHPRPGGDSASGGQTNGTNGAGRRPAPAAEVGAPAGREARAALGLLVVASGINAAAQRLSHREPAQRRGSRAHR